MGGRGNVAYSLKQHEQYYDTWGETFERFALIKARPIAGDRTVGDRFSDLVQPFVYRRYLDHAALEEMFRYRARGKPSQDDADRDVKSGRGGIREVELCTQVLQLTYGGRDRSLREANTLSALDALERAGLMVKEVQQDLSRAYRFLRTVEHRLQIVHEQQTHAVARTEQELNICARRLDFADGAALNAELDRQRRRVHEIYRSIFERRRGTSDFRSRQFFRVLVEEASEAEALELVREYGLPDPVAALDVIRALGEATGLSPSRSMARNVLANLLPPLLERMARGVRPVQVLMRLEQMTARTGAAGSFYRTLLENAPLRDLLVSMLDLGDLPAGRLIRYPELLDSLLYTLPDLDELRTRYESTLEGFAPGSQGRDQIRRFKAIEEFKILLDWAADRSLAALQERLSLLADCSVARAAAWNAPEPAAAEWAILALGKLGGRELTVHSDLDLVVVYRGDPHDSRTFVDFQNFVEQIMRSLEEPTSEGIAYHVDTRLRPEGRKGALAMPLEVFQAYLETRAEIWERLAWTRYRFLAGSRALAQKIDAAVEAFVYAPWDPRIPRYMTAVRRRMERELGDRSGQKLEFKIGRGALADIDFLLQMIQIKEGHRRFEFRTPGTRRLLEQLSLTSLLTATEIDELRRAHDFLRSLEVFARLGADANVSAAPSDPRRLEPIGRQLQMAEPAGQNLLRTYRRTTGRVRAIYRTVIGRL
jgi:glutamate-ammonia-ligase adenylyltransferase